MSKLVRLHHNAPVDVLLENAKGLGLKEVVILGYFEDEDANMYHDTNVSDGPTTLWMLETAKLLMFKAIPE